MTHSSGSGEKQHQGLWKDVGGMVEALTLPPHGIPELVVRKLEVVNTKMFVFKW